MCQSSGMSREAGKQAGRLASCCNLSRQQLLCSPLFGPLVGITPPIFNSTIPPSKLKKPSFAPTHGPNSSRGTLEYMEDTVQANVSPNPECCHEENIFVSFSDSGRSRITLSFGMR